MGFIDKINRKMNPGAYENDDIFDESDIGEEDEDDYEERVETKSDKKESIPSRRNLGSEKVVDFTSAASLREKAAQEHAEAQAAAQAAAIAEATSKPMEVVVIEPKTFDDSQQVSQCLMDKRPVVINFENTDTEVAHRIVDFISGTIYALDGDIRKISRNVFLCAPKNVTLTNGDIDSSLGDFGWMKK